MQFVATYHTGLGTSLLRLEEHGFLVLTDWTALIGTRELETVKDTRQHQVQQKRVHTTRAPQSWVPCAERSDRRIIDGRSESSYLAVCPYRHLKVDPNHHKVLPWRTSTVSS
jgi:hypothetical protein